MWPAGRLLPAPVLDDSLRKSHKFRNKSGKDGNLESRRLVDGDPNSIFKRKKKTEILTMLGCL